MTSLPSPASEPGRLARAIVPAVLVFGDASLTLAITGAPGALTDASRVRFRAKLQQLERGVIVLGSPPATIDDVEAAVAIRADRAGVRVVFVNAPADVDARLRALELGADEALPRSVPARELAARVALLHVRPVAPPALVDRRRTIGVTSEIRLDLAGRRVSRGRDEIHLRPKELALLSVLATHPGRAFSRAELLETVWGDAYGGDARTVDVHIRWLRAKLEPDPGRPRHLLTVRGHGYRFDPPRHARRPQPALATLIES